MATQTLELVVENGMFRSVDGALPFPEGQHVKVTVESEEEEQLDTPETQRKPFIFGLHAGKVGWDPSFDDELPDSFWLGEE